VKRWSRSGLAAGLAVTLLAAGFGAQPANASRARSHHVLLISVDGLHQSDLAAYVESHPRSALADLASNGTSYTHARTTFPSDSFPGMVAQLTGGGPGTTGVLYDDTYNPDLLHPSTLDCATASPGTEVAWTETADRSHDPIALDAGQRLKSAALASLSTNTLAQTLAAAPAITDAILAMTPTPQTLLDPATLPVQPTTCLPLYPHQYLKVNTVFEVARSHGLRTAWSDKHPAYEILNGPSGSGLQDLFTPEINSVADAAGDDWTTNNALTQVYDSTKVAAVINEIGGLDHSGTRRVGTPAIFGMNFQTVSTAEKLPTSNGLAGGYEPDGTPGPLLSNALDYIDAQIGRMQAALTAHHLQKSTTIILSAKHGQAPVERSALRRVDDAAIITALDAAWKVRHPQAEPLVRFSVDDDVMLLWLSDTSKSTRAFAKAFLLNRSAPANRDGDPKGTYSTTVARSGLRSVLTGRAVADRLGSRRGDRRVPTLVGLVQPGVVYTSGVKKIAEHGGAAPADLNVALVVSGAGVRHGATSNAHVSTTQIAPSILRLLGLQPHALAAVRVEHTRVLPKLR
jgi:hypothetical protein